MGPIAWASPGPTTPFTMGAVAGAPEVTGSAFEVLATPCGPITDPAAISGAGPSVPPGGDADGTAEVLLTFRSVPPPIPGFRVESGAIGSDALAEDPDLGAGPEVFP